MTSAFLCAECGISNSVIENQAAYIDGWMDALRKDNHLIIVAAGQAQKAANMVLGVEYEKKLPSPEKRRESRAFAENLAKEIAEEKRLKQKHIGFEMSR